MTAPHRYIENQFARISRETQNALPLILPDARDALSREIHYIFARESARLKIVILALSVTPFGYDAVIFDPEMKRSQFLKSVNQCISLAVKRCVGHGDSVWSNSKPGNLPILDIESLKKAIFEVCIIPVNAGYVRRIENWVLPTIGPCDWGQVKTISAPEPRHGRPQKESVEHNPGVLKLVSYATKIFDLKAGLLTDIRQFQLEERRRRKSVLKRVDRYNGKAFRRAKWRRADIDKVSALSISAGKLKAVAETIKRFRREYRLALTLFNPTNWPIFPCGTLKLREYHKVVCEQMENDPFIFDAS